MATKALAEEILKELKEDEEKPKDTPQEDWVKGYNKWRKTQ